MFIRVFGKSRLRFSLQVRSKTEDRNQTQFSFQKSVRGAEQKLFGLRQKETLVRDPDFSLHIRKTTTLKANVPLLYYTILYYTLIILSVDPGSSVGTS